MFTSLRVSGYTEAELVQQVFDGREIGVEDLQKFQRINPEKNVFDTIKGLAIEEPQLPPLYFVLVRFWVQLFGSWGNSIAVTRSFSVFLSLIALPCIYWLCQELWQSSLTSLMATALTSVSLFHVVYAQEARPYAMWTVTILLSSTFLLRAMRLGTKLSWVLYAVSLVVGLYTFLFSALVMLSHGVYVVITEDWRFSKTVKAYLLASLGSAIAFAPWLVVMLSNLYAAKTRIGWALASTRVGWAVEPNYLSLLGRWGYNTQLGFFDFGKQIYLIAIVLVLVLYSLYHLYKTTTTRLWLLIFSLIGTTLISLMLVDIVEGGLLSRQTRYIVPFYVGIHLSTAYLLSTQILANSFVKSTVWQSIMALLVTCCLVACVLNSQADISLSTNLNRDHVSAARIIGQAKSPLVIGYLAHITSLSYALKPEVRFRVVGDPTKIKTYDGFSDIFLYAISEPKLKIVAKNSKNYNVKNIPEVDGLWRLEKK